MGESSAKRAKADGADNEEEDPLVRRREELILEVANARAEGTAKEDLRAVCATLEAKNQKYFGGRRLPREMWQKIVDENLHQNDLLALAMTCRFFRDTTKDFGWKIETNLDIWDYSGLFDLRIDMLPSHSFDWYRWVCDTFEILPGFEEWRKNRVKGAVYEGDLVNFAALQGSAEILRWLIEKEGWETNCRTGEWAGYGGSVEVLAYLKDYGYQLDEEACRGAAEEGHLEALKFLRAQKPPCPWDADTCTYAARGRAPGRFEVCQRAGPALPLGCVDLFLCGAGRAL